MLNPGEVLNGTYRIINRIGSGGGGIVYKAYHLRLKKHVAVKLIKDEVRGIINERAETDILKNLHHEGLPQVYDFVNDGENVYTVMDYIEGGSLFDAISERGALPYGLCLKYAKELCSAAAYLHTRKPKIIHSDIKPQNVMITAEGKLCLIDFNISSAFGGDVYTVGSSDGYSPPEQYLAGRRSMDDATEVLDDTEPSKGIIDTRSDVYSIGAVMYAMITGHKPNNARKEIVSMLEYDENIPEAYVYITEKAMSKEKNRRFASAVEMLSALEKINRLDRRYKHMRAKRTAACIFCVMLFSASAVMSVFGYRCMQEEHAEKLSNYISQISSLCAEGSFSEAESVYLTAANEFSDTASQNNYRSLITELEYHRALILYSEQLFDEAKDYITENVVNGISDLSNELASNTYFMLADIYFQEENYEAAVPYYEKAIEYYSENADIYRDYAISYARLNNADKAEEILEDAIAHGLTADGIYAVTGEIKYVLGEYESAIESLKNAIEISDNDQLKKNAYLVCQKSYDALIGTGDKTIMLECIELLEYAVSDLPIEMTMQIRESLAQEYIDYGQFSGMTEYYTKAIQLIYDMKAYGWSNYNADMNIAVLLDAIGDTQGAKNYMLDMLENSDYAQYYYMIYIRLAYCEADIQGKKDISERDYGVFYEYYLCAEEEYEEFSKNGASEPEMGRLRELVQELENNGWL